MSGLRRRVIYPKDIASFEQVASATEGESYGVAALGGAAGVQAFPPHIYPPAEGYTDFFPPSAAQTVTGPNTTVVLTLPTLTLPTNSVGVIRELNFSVNSLLTSSDITFQVLVNGSPKAGFDSISIFPRAAASVNLNLPPESTFMKLPDGALVQIRVTVVDGGSYQLGADFRGWFFSKSVGDKYGFRS